MNTHVRNLLTAAAFAFGVLSPLPAGAEQDFGYCLSCHGSDGNGNLALRAPRIAGMESWYVEQQMLGFANGWRGSHVLDDAGNEMHQTGQRVARENAVADAVAFVASLEPRPTAQRISGDVERGKTLYEPCKHCHGDRGEGIREAHAPALIVADDWYLTTQLRNFRDGIRGTHADDRFGAEMRPFALVLDDESAIVDVVAYINSLR